MNLSEIISRLDLKVLTQALPFESRVPTSGYASDLLSCVIANAEHGSIWVTLQAHTNVVAVAALSELCAVIITEDSIPDTETIAKAIEENVILLSTPHNTYHIVGKLWEMGLK